MFATIKKSEIDEYVERFVACYIYAHSNLKKFSHAMVKPSKRMNVTLLMPVHHWNSEFIVLDVYIRNNFLKILRICECLQLDCGNKF